MPAQDVALSGRVVGGVRPRTGGGTGQGWWWGVQDGAGWGDGAGDGRGESRTGQEGLFK